jgi:hypothetical protein
MSHRASCLSSGGQTDPEASFLVSLNWYGITVERAGSFTVVLAIVLKHDTLAFFPSHPGITLIILAYSLSASGICGAASYVLLGRKQTRN